MATDDLRALLTLLREFGVLEYAGEGVSVKLGGSVSVIKHDGAVDSEPSRRPAAEMSPEAAKMKAIFERMNPAYRQHFEMLP